MRDEFSVSTPEARARNREASRVRMQGLRQLDPDSAEGKAFRDKKRQSQAHRRDRLRALVRDFKVASEGCTDCGRSDLPPEVLDIDHVSGTREFSLARATTRGIEAVKRELEKCEVRCPTCHALRHYNERTVEHGRYG